MENSIDKIVYKYSDSDFMHAVFELEKEINRLKSIKPRKQHLTDYINAGREILFFLGSGIKPHGLSDADFMKLKPMIKNMSDKGQLDKKIMGYFDKEG